MWEKLRRFGLEYCDLPTTFDNVTNLLRVLALNIDRRGEGTSVIFIVLTATFVVVYFYVCVFSAFWFLFWRGTESMVAKSVVASLSLFSVITIVKLICMHLYSDRMTKGMKNHLSFDVRINRESRMYQNLMKAMRVVKLRASFVWSMLVSNSIIYLIIPAVRPGRNLIEESQVLYGLEPMLESPNFEISQTLVGITAFMTAYTAATFSALMIIVVGYIEAQMTALSNEILHLWDDAQTVILEDSEGNQQQQTNEKIHILRNQYIKRQLETIIQAHTGNLSLFRSTEYVFSNPLFMEFLLLGMALITELLGGLENTYVVVPFTLAQVAMNCFTGQRLMEASMRFRDAVYACNWENLDVSNMKTVVVILENSGTMVLSAGGIAELRYTTLMSVLRSIYSAYTTLRSTMS